MQTKIQRSMLILPVHVRKFVEKVYLRGADAIVLDLEDAVPPSEKEKARGFVKEAIGLAGKGGADVFVRVNNEPSLLEHDLQAAVQLGLHGIFLPKVESAEDVISVGAKIGQLEAARRLEPGAIRLSLHIESPAALLRIQEIAAAGSRTESMSLGMDDYCFQLGVEPTEEAAELFFPLTMLITACKASRILPLGVVGSLAKIRDMETFEKAARRGAQIGFVGSLCVHPDQVAVVNRVFSPSDALRQDALRIVEAFEAGMRSGRAAINLDDRMIDTPIYKRAKQTLDRARDVEELERRKAAALALHSG
jgi:citrate lyase subunit beta / citryl-CoA lyase